MAGWKFQFYPFLVHQELDLPVSGYLLYIIFTLFSITPHTTELRFVLVLSRDNCLALRAFDMPHPHGMEPTTLESFSSRCKFLPLLASTGSEIPHGQCTTF